jgi:O-antigen/teichoic acid export membrane protein
MITDQRNMAEDDNMTRGRRYLTWLRKTAASEAGFLLLTVAAGFVFSYIYQIMMGRLLGPEDFGSLGALYAIFLITGLFGQALMQAIATNVAEIKARRDEAVAIGSFLRLSVKLAVICLLFTIACLAVSGPITHFFHLDSVAPVVLLVFSIFASLLLNILLGMQQGLSRFRHVGITGYLTPQVLKLVLGVVLVYISFGLLGAIGVLAASSGLAIIVGVFIGRGSLDAGLRQRAGQPMKLGHVLFPTLVLAVFLALPSNIDVMLVKHYFPGTEAGMYAAMATLGKVVYFLPMAVSFVLLPRATEACALGRDARPLLLRCLGLVLFLSGAVVLVYWFCPDILTMMFGDSYAGALSMVSLYALAMLLFSLNVVLMHYSLAIRQMRLMLLVDLITLAEVLAIVFQHDTLTRVIWIIFYGNLVILTIGLPYLAARKTAVSARESYACKDKKYMYLAQE